MQGSGPDRVPSDQSNFSKMGASILAARETRTRQDGLPTIHTERTDSVLATTEDHSHSPFLERCHLTHLPLSITSHY